MLSGIFSDVTFTTTLITNLTAALFNIGSDYVIQSTHLNKSFMNSAQGSAVCKKVRHRSDRLNVTIEAMTYPGLKPVPAEELEAVCLKYVSGEPIAKFQ